MQCHNFYEKYRPKNFYDTYRPKDEYDSLIFVN